MNKTLQKALFTFSVKKSVKQNVENLKGFKNFISTGKYSA